MGGDQDMRGGKVRGGDGEVGRKEEGEGEV